MNMLGSIGLLLLGLMLFSPSVVLAWGDINHGQQQHQQPQQWQYPSYSRSYDQQSTPPVNSTRLPGAANTEPRQQASEAQQERYKQPWEDRPDKTFRPDRYRPGGDS